MSGLVVLLYLTARSLYIRRWQPRHGDGVGWPPRHSSTQSSIVKQRNMEYSTSPELLLSMKAPSFEGRVVFQGTSTTWIVDGRGAGGGGRGVSEGKSSFVDTVVVVDDDVLMQHHIWKPCQHPYPVPIVESVGDDEEPSWSRGLMYGNKEEAP